MGHTDEMTQVKYYQSVSDEQRRSLALGLTALYGVQMPIETVGNEPSNDNANTLESAQNPHSSKKPKI